MGTGQLNAEGYSWDGLASHSRRGTELVGSGGVQILGEMTNLNMIFHVVVSAYRFVKIWTHPSSRVSRKPRPQNPKSQTHF